MLFSAVTNRAPRCLRRKEDKVASFFRGRVLLLAGFRTVGRRPLLFDAREKISSAQILTFGIPTSAEMPGSKGPVSLHALLAASAAVQCCLAVFFPFAAMPRSHL